MNQVKESISGNFEYLYAMCNEMRKNPFANQHCQQWKKVRARLRWTRMAGLPLLCPGAVQCSVSDDGDIKTIGQEILINDKCTWLYRQWDMGLVRVLSNKNYVPMTPPPPSPIAHIRILLYRTHREREKGGI
jgi:hypothetical protein